MKHSVLLRFKVAIVFLASCIFMMNCSATADEPVDLVYPHLDSVNSRWFFFDSASRPFGLVNLSPDTGLGGAWGSGYRYNETEVKGFSHVHAWQLSAVSMMPISSNQDIADIKQDYFSNFSHDTETVKPGYHKLHLDRYNIDVELTSTTRVGFHKYDYPKGQPQQILIKLGGEMGPSKFGHGEAHLISPTAIAGYVTNQATHRRPRPSKVYFHAEFKQKIADISAWRNGKIEPNVNGTSGLDAGLLVSFDSKGDAPSEQLMKVGISYVSEENAYANIATELPHWNFEKVVTDSKHDWNNWLSKIKVTGGTQQQQQRFYTDLWHALQGRRIISDANGQYTDQTGTRAIVKQLPLDSHGVPLFNHHNSDSFWGAQWTIATLWPLAYPKVASDFTNSLLQYHQDGGIIPRGPSGGNYTYVMTGASSTPFIVSNYMKGIRDFDVELAYTALKKNHSTDGIMSRAGYEHFTQTGGGMQHYLEKGYIPYPLSETESLYGNHRRGPGQTLEYAFQDHTLANFAASLGKKDDDIYYRARSKNYRNVYDSESGFMRPKNVDGTWQTPFDPYQYENGFVEANPAQGTWNVAHDIDGLASLMGGKDILISRLEAAFETAEKQGFTSGTAHADESLEEFRRTPINYGNQPSIQTAFIFSAVGAPWKTQYWSRKVVDTVFSSLSPTSGYNGDEDQGLMGSLAVLMKIGLFQLTGGTEQDPIYFIGSPIFDSISITLDDQYYSGKTFTIKTLNNGPETPYVKAISLNGIPLDRTYLTHQEIVSGGELVLEMSNQPNMNLH
ncbi:GH92 family glycosyl hydrolase [Paraglaciecola sp.]|uniref:GH92 family glycosyl hydrolase n=1 Tax=Paraglaciecola sp. TaxID=1920173 RepID=UPI003263A31D